MDLITLYVVDDYLLNRIAYKRNFNNDNNFKVLGVFSNPYDCILEMKKQEGDIVLLDIDLPDLKGVEAISKI